MAITTDARAATPASVDSRDEARAATPAAADNRVESHTLVQPNSAHARHALIAEAAYRRAQARGFAAGEDWQDWFAAEREVDALLDPDL